MPKTAALCTMGCKVNSYESQGMQELLEKDGYTIVPFDAPADVYIINTCTVTQIAARKSRQMIHRARAMNEKAIVIAAGCYVDRDDSLIKEGVIDLAVKNSRKADIIGLIDAYQKGLSEPSSHNRMTISKGDGHTRAFIKIQDGCRQYCTYCIIPYVRGPLSSRPVEECVEEASVLAKAGFTEVVLTGIHVTSYGSDLKKQEADPAGKEPLKPVPDLADLILAISQIEGIERIRLSSLEPTLITEAFLDKVSQTNKLCPHFHLALQSGCDKTLKAMNRKYTTNDFRRAVALLRERYPMVAITTDIIVGFPGETEEDHLASLDFAREIGFAEGHIFRYSPMEGTVAARRKDQIDGNVKKRRSDEMLQVVAASTRQFMEGMQHKETQVLLEEKDEDGYWTGYTPNYQHVAVMDYEGAKAGLKVDVRVDGYVEKRSANHDASGVNTILKGVRQ